MIFISVTDPKGQSGIIAYEPDANLVLTPGGKVREVLPLSGYPQRDQDACIKIYNWLGGEFKQHRFNPTFKATRVDRFIVARFYVDDVVYIDMTR